MSARLPLFDLPRLRELESLEAERDVLAERIEKLPVNSHKRVILQDRLQAVTLAALRTEAEMEVRP